MAGKNTNQNESEKKETLWEEIKETFINVEEKVEEKVEVLEEKTDEEVEALVKKLWFTDKIVKAQWMKNLLNSPFVDGSNKRARKHLNTLWWILLVLGILLTIYSIGMLFVWIFDIFRGSLWMFVLALVFIILSILILKVSRWLLRTKKWLPALSVVCVIINFIIMIISIFTVRTILLIYIIVTLIISIVVTLYVLKNKDMFKNK